MITMEPIDYFNLNNPEELEEYIDYINKAKQKEQEGIDWKEHDWKLARFKSLECLFECDKATQEEVNNAKTKFLIIAEKVKNYRD